MSGGGTHINERKTPVWGGVLKAPDGKGLLEAEVIWTLAGPHPTWEDWQQLESMAMQLLTLARRQKLDAFDEAMK